MLDKPKRMLAVILGREAVESRWETHHWQLVGVVPDVGGEARTIVDNPASRQCLFPGFEVTLFADEAEGYYLNASSEVPSVFVSIRSDEAGGEPYPLPPTLSDNEGARRVDGGGKVG